MNNFYYNNYKYIKLNKTTDYYKMLYIFHLKSYYILFSGNNIHVLDLKLDSRSKAETVRSSSDLGSSLASYLLWDQSSSRLYVGDESGKVHLMTVHSNKVCNCSCCQLINLSNC